MSEVPLPEDEARRCLNCGAAAPAAFCPQCGQGTNVGLPTFRELLLDTLGAVFSYDSKLWRTLGALVRRPGDLTVAYLEGRRVRHLTPFQIFFWLQAVAFLAHREFFPEDSSTIDAKSRFLLVVGGFVALALSLIYVRRRQRFVAHLVAAVHIWAFLMLLLLAEYALVPPAGALLVRLGTLPSEAREGVFMTYSAELAMLAYVTLALRRIYRVAWPYALAQALGLLACFTVAVYAAGAASGMR